MSDEFFGPDLPPVACLECDGWLRDAPVALIGLRKGYHVTVRMQGLRCDACGFQTLRGRQLPEFAHRVVMSSLIIVLHRLQEDRSCGTTTHVSPLVRGVMSRFWYNMANAAAAHYWKQRLVQVLYAHLAEEAKYLG